MTPELKALQDREDARVLNFMRDNMMTMTDMLRSILRIAEDHNGADQVDGVIKYAKMMNSFAKGE